MNNNGKGGLSSSLIIQGKCINMSVDNQIKCLMKLNKEVEEKNKILHEEKQKQKKKKKNL